MPVEFGEKSYRHEWPVKIMKGNYSNNKKISLECRYARRKINLIFR